MQDTSPPHDADEAGRRAASRIGLWLDRFGILALDRPRLALACFVVLGALSIFGLQHIQFESDLRGFFSGEGELFRTYQQATDTFVDPENQELVLVEGDLATPANFTKLRDLHYELGLLDGVGSVYSPFALRVPGGEGARDLPLLIEDPETGLTPDLAAKIRAHPLSGDRLLAADGRSILFVVTPSTAKADVHTHKAIADEIDATAREALADSGLTATLTGYPRMRNAMVDALVQDQRRLNQAGALVGVVLSLAVFRSVTASILTAVPAILGGLFVVGLMGLMGIKVTTLSIVVPVLVMILGYTSGMHLSYAFRREREEGRSVAEAERISLIELGPACMLSALTTSVAFASLGLSDIALFRDFGWTGAIAVTGSGVVVLAGHALAALAIGRFWRVGRGRSPSPLNYLGAPSAALARFAMRFAWPLSTAALVVVLLLTVVFTLIPPQHSVREHLPVGNPANTALGRIDAAHGGASSVIIVVPTGGASATDPATLEKIGRVHRAVAPFGAARPLSVWSLVEWLGGNADAATADRIRQVLAALPESDRSRVSGAGGSAPVLLYMHEQPTVAMNAYLDRIEAAARAAGGDDVVVTGPTVLASRETARSIGGLTINLVFSIAGGIALIALAFMDARAGIVAILPNTLPILATASILFVLGRGMQFTSVIALIVAFGVAVDNTVHYLSRYKILGRAGGLEATSRLVGPVLIGTTSIIVVGLSATLTSSLPTVSLFGTLLAATLVSALISDLLVLPALMAGPARKWFQS